MIHPYQKCSFKRCLAGKTTTDFNPLVVTFCCPFVKRETDVGAYVTCSSAYAATPSVEALRECALDTLEGAISRALSRLDKLPV